MQIKAGDKVRIKSWDKLYEENELDDLGEIARGPGFVLEMQKFCGELLTVVDGDEDFPPANADGFFAGEDEEDYMFCDWMVEEVVSEI